MLADQRLLLHSHKKDYHSRSHRSNNHGTLHGTVSLLFKLALTYDDLPASDRLSAAAIYAASVPQNYQTTNQTNKQPINQTAKGTLAICNAIRYATRATAAGGHCKPAAVAFACD